MDQAIQTSNIIKVGEWERNGYHDSDFYTVYWFRDTKKLQNICTGTTRCYDNGSGVIKSTPYDKLPPDEKSVVYNEIRDFVLPKLELQIKNANEHAINFPKSEAVNNYKVILKENHKNRAKELTKCTKCDGGGHWVNPKNKDDKRTCFSCNGLGSWVKSAKGGPMTTIKAGTIANVHKVATYDPHWVQFKSYALTCKTEAGLIITVPLDKVKLDKEYMTEGQIKTRAKSSFEGCGINWTLKNVL